MNRTPSRRHRAASPRRRSQSGRRVVAAAACAVLITMGASAQGDGRRAFADRFRPLDGDTVHVHTLGFNTGLAAADSINVRQLGEIGMPKDLGASGNALRAWALGRVRLDGDMQGLLVRVLLPDTREDYVFLYSYRPSTDSIGAPVAVSYSSGYEGASSVTESWFLDLDHDGDRDMVTREYTVRLTAPDAREKIVDRFTANRWRSGAFHPDHLAIGTKRMRRLFSLFMTP